MENEHFSKKQIEDKLVLSLFFNRPDPDKPNLELYLAGTIKAKFAIDTGKKDEDGSQIFQWENNAIICDKIKVVPSKKLQPMLSKKLKIEEIRPLLADNSEGKVDDLINLFYIKLNQIYAKQKLYGREVKDFDIS